MKPANLSRLVLAAIFCAATVAAAATAASAADVSKYDPRKLPVPPIGRIPAVTPTRFALPNGVVVYLLENHELPLVKGTAYFPSSPSLVPADRAGLMGLAGDVMRSGGTAAHPGDWLDDHLGAIGGAINSNIAVGLANTGFRCLAENTAEVVGLWTEVTRSPAFPDAKIDLAKVGLRRQIASRNDEMLPMLFRAASRAVYGKGSPWAMQAEYATVEPISHDDCVRLHGQVFVPERMTVAIYGDFRTADMKKLLTARLGDWKKSGSVRPVMPPTPASVEPKIYFAPKEDVTQSGIVVAQPGSRADDPDYAPLQVLEQGLGGGFSSRMVQHIRTQRGLAYAAGARAGSDFQKPGVFMGFTLTRSDSTMLALDLVRAEVKAVTDAPFTEAELQTAKQAVVNGFVFNFEDPSQTLFRAAYYEAIGYPADFLQRYQKALDDVTSASVLAAARRKITPARQVVIIVGKEGDFDRPLASAGLPVERVDISIPPPPSKRAGGAAATASPEARKKGGEWLAAAAKAAGGSAAWAAIKTISVATDATLSMQGQSIAVTGEETWSLPNRQVSVQKLPFGEVRQGFDGKVGWMAGMGQSRDNPKAAEDCAKDYEHSLWRLFGEPSKVEAVALEAPEKVGEQEFRAAAVTGAKSQDLTLLFAPDGRLAGYAYQDEGSGQMEPARVVELYADWSAEGALQYPHSVKVLRNGATFLDSKVTAVKVNPAVTDEMFAKPAK
jgi:zinc protease